jgi:CDP-glucose 4,6-dehydratase
MFDEKGGVALNSTQNIWKDRSVFVTGATGLLGSWLVPALHNRGANVVALVRDGSPRSLLVRDGWLKRIATVHGSLSDEGLLRRTFAEYGVETVFHLGAQTLVGVAKVDPIGTLEANVRGTWNLLDAARLTGVKQTLVASSDKAYGASSQLPYKEDFPLQGRYPYDVSKSCADLISSMYAETFRLPVCIVRCGNLFGGGDLNFSRLIPGVITSALRGEPFLIRSDGKFVRDFLYVEDAAEAYMTLAESLAADPSLAGEAFNFCLGLRLTTLELTRKILAMMGRTELKPVVQNIATTEIREQYASSEKAIARLGWTPRCGVDEGLRRTIAWYEGHHEAEIAAMAAASTASAAD